MWRVEEQHFNPKMNSNYMMSNDQDSGIGNLNMNAKDEQSRQELKKILKHME